MAEQLGIVDLTVLKGLLELLELRAIKYGKVVNNTHSDKELRTAAEDLHWTKKLLSDLMENAA